MELLCYGEGQNPEVKQEKEEVMKNSLVIMPERYANIARFFNGINEEELSSQRSKTLRKENLRTMRFQINVTDEEPHSSKASKKSSK